MTWKSMGKPDPFDLALYGLIISVIIAAIYGFQLKAMRDQVDLMEKQFTISHRPWVGVPNPANVIEALTFDSDGAHIGASFALKNGGNSPAVGINTTISLVISTWRTLMPDIEGAIQEGCSPDWVKPLLKKKRGIPLLLPGDTITFPEPTRVLMHRKDFHVSPTDKLVQAWIVLSVQYEGDFDGKLYCSAIAQAYRSDDRRSQFEPIGTVQGSLTQTGFGRAY